ncbi:ABC-2 type transport system permease protein [Paenibacillus phyllosphaerae]|uniref:ABC-2 type transport system permease protein n=1 Tax=Paenibacillus phyllosphaerae TaxID=274593 RepID=A0A7W5FNA5_9BACL|nr:ABC-2 family transporter protein [Paenibacillus phyllosphaerae]MBB3111131.1 ABC-2 type transport system permease protein [Paenibacillus phyllosphaerae]
MNWIRLYIRLAGASFRAQMQYKFNFAFSSLMAFGMFGIEFLTVGTVIYKFGGVGGWGVYEVGYLFALMMFNRALYRMFASEINGFEKYLVEGLLDQLLLRPVPVLLVLMTRQFRPMLGELFLGGTILTLSLQQLDAAGQIVWYTALAKSFAAILSGAIFTFSFGVLTATVGFWTHRIDDLRRITDDATTNACYYPLTIYPGWMRMMLLTVLPMGFTSYVPALHIIRGEIGVWVLPATLLFALLLLMGALRFWRFGIAHYQSTGT